MKIRRDPFSGRRAAPHDVTPALGASRVRAHRSASARAYGSAERMAPKKGKANPRDQYFKSIRENGHGRSMDTLRWCLKHGGVTTRAQDEDDMTGIQIAAAGGFQASLELLLEFVKKAGDPSELEEVDDDGRTPLMVAAYNGKFEVVRMLVLDGKARLDTKDEQGKTAMQLAQARKHEKIAAFLANPKEWKEEESEDEDEDEEAAKKKKFMAAQKLATQATAARAQEEVHRKRVEAADELEKALASAAKPVWAEVEKVIKEKQRALSLKGKAPLELATGPVDPAVWQCVCLFELRIEIADRALTSLPPQLSRLVDLVTLIVSGNALARLPDEVGTLAKLRNLEAAGNELEELPASLAQLAGLQVLNVANNRLKSLAPIAKLEALVSVSAGHNALEELPLSWESLEHMQRLEAPHNQIRDFPRGIGCLQQLVTLDLAHNQIEQVPMELSNLTVKKLQSVKLRENPLADPRIRRFVEDDSPTLVRRPAPTRARCPRRLSHLPPTRLRAGFVTSLSPASAPASSPPFPSLPRRLRHLPPTRRPQVKDLLNHVKKFGFKGEEAGGKKGGKKGKKGKSKAAAVAEESDGSDDADVAALLAQMAAGSDSDGAVDVS